MIRVKCDRILEVINKSKGELLMNINLNVLSPFQRELDEKICEKHNIDSSKTINERILAFLVELGELANETRCFKYWSFKNASKRTVILEEYVDGIHFLVSLGNELDLDLQFNFERINTPLTRQFIDVFSFAGTLQENFNENNLRELFTKYLMLGEKLGFNQEDIIAGYQEKNKVNHQRQEENY